MRTPLDQRIFEYFTQETFEPLYLEVLRKKLDGLSGAEADALLSDKMNERLRELDLPLVKSWVATRLRMTFNLLYPKKLGQGSRGPYKRKESLATPAVEAVEPSTLRQMAYDRVAPEMRILLKHVRATLGAFREQHPRLSADVVSEAFHVVLRDTCNVKLQTMLAEELLTVQQRNIGEVLSRTHLVV